MKILFNKKIAAYVFSGFMVLIQECESPAESTEEYRKWAGDLAH